MAKCASYCTGSSSSSSVVENSFLTLKFPSESSFGVGFSRSFFYFVLPTEYKVLRICIRCHYHVFKIKMNERCLKSEKMKSITVTIWRNDMLCWSMPTHFSFEIIFFYVSIVHLNRSSSVGWVFCCLFA